MPCAEISSLSSHVARMSLPGPLVLSDGGPGKARAPAGLGLQHLAERAQIVLGVGGGFGFNSGVTADLRVCH